MGKEEAAYVSTVHRCKRNGFSRTVTRGKQNDLCRRRACTGNAGHGHQSYYTRCSGFRDRVHSVGRVTTRETDWLFRYGGIGSPSRQGPRKFLETQSKRTPSCGRTRARVWQRVRNATRPIRPSSCNTRDDAVRAAMVAVEGLMLLLFGRGFSFVNVVVFSTSRNRIDAQ